MKTIDFPRENVYGEEYTREVLEKWYVEDLEGEIKGRLNTIVKANSSAEQSLQLRIIKYLPQILVMSPSRMIRYAKAVDSLYGGILNIGTRTKPKLSTFGESILSAFNYAGYRYSKLVELAARLNVKTCPYCNMSYTLYSEQITPWKKRIAKTDKFARFQFDHFLSKRKYPMLSMCLYNLIPSCPSCNQGKSERFLPIIFNPYLSNIHSLFTFEVNNPLKGYFGGRFKDYTPVRLVWDSSVKKDESDAFENTFHPTVLYCRHGDVVQEVFDKAYEIPYYMDPSNFFFLRDRRSSYLKRLWFGNYMEKEDIQNRPLAKFIQDICEQAYLEKCSLDASDGIT